MKIHVIFAQRKQRYEGEYGLEIVAAMSEYDESDNTEYLPMALRDAQASNEFEAVNEIVLNVDEKAVRKRLFPATDPIDAEVQE